MEQQKVGLFEAWMEALKPHYASVHADVMSDPTKTMENMDEVDWGGKQGAI